MLRPGRWLFSVGIIAFIVLGVWGLHYRFGYSWRFVGSFAANVAVPLIMAWAGGYLAAEVKPGTERKLWQAVFALLAVLGLVGSFWVESHLDQEHQKEMGDLREGIKNDVGVAISEYNQGHPQQPITPEAERQIAKSVREGFEGKARAVSVPTAKVQEEQSDAAFKQSLDAASGVFGELQYLAGRWQEEDEVILVSIAMTPDEKRKAKAGRDKAYLDQARPLMIAANYFRVRLLDHLPAGQNADNLNSDEKEAAVFADVAAKRSISPEEARQAAWYLGQLINRVVNKVN